MFKGICLITLTLLLHVFYPAHALAEPDLKPTIDITIQPAAKSALFHKVAILPFTGSYPARQELRSFFHTRLDQTNKYPLMATSQTDFLLDKAGDNTTKKSVQLSVVETGKKLQSRGIITGSISPPRSSSENKAAADNHYRILITLWDIQTAKPAWKVTIKIPYTADTPPPDNAAFTDALEQATELLLDRLVRMGAIYTPGIPAPIVASKQGDIRKIQVVIQPAPQSIHTRYQLLRAKAATDIFSPVGQPSPNNTSPLILEDENLEDASTYWYTVIGYNNDGLASIPGQPFPITTKGKPQAVPEVKATGNGLRQVPLSWERAQDLDVTGYVIYRKTKEAETFTKIAAIDDRDRQSYLDRGSANSYERYGKLADNTEYFYMIRSRNKVKVESEDSPVVSAVTKGAPAPPSQLTAIDNQPRRVSLSWKEDSDPHTRGYALFRATNTNGPFSQIDFIDGRQSKETVDQGSFGSPLQDNTRYYYKLQAVNVVDNHSQDSKIAAATTKPVPKAVKALALSQNLVKKAEIGWQPNPEKDIYQYEIFRGNQADNISKKVATIPAGRYKFTDTGLADGRTYWYAIRAIDRDSLKGTFSAPIKKTTKPRPAPPTSLQASANGQSILLTWDKNSEPDIVYYKVMTVGFLDKEIGRTFTNRFLFRQDIQADREYRFQIVAVDKDELESGNSTIVSIRTPPVGGEK
ncbi:hypothetical protein [Desulfogranum marinum]|uniref:fibronectin type III domain-containing protein n=1 Tax=Desulfogranum marinum TaxID=453220 RepID=UPI0029C8713F|nr:hypothetical protein [Desulfogranum marinum]